MVKRVARVGDVKARRLERAAELLSGDVLGTYRWLYAGVGEHARVLVAERIDRRDHELLCGVLRTQRRRGAGSDVQDAHVVGGDPVQDIEHERLAQRFGGIEAALELVRPFEPAGGDVLCPEVDLGGRPRSHTVCRLDTFAPQPAQQRPSARHGPPEIDAAVSRRASASRSTRRSPKK